MQQFFLILCLIVGNVISCQDSIYMYEERAILGNIVHIDTLMILYHKNNQSI